MADLTKENLEKELEKDLAELEGKKSKQSTTKKTTKGASKKATKKEVKKTAKKKMTKPTENEPKKKVVKAETEKKIPEIKPVEKMNLDKKAETKTDKKPDQAAPSEDEIRSKKIFYGGIVAIIILFVALLLGGKYLPSTGATGAATLDYNNFHFVQDNTHWVFEWQRDNVVYSIPLRFNPEQVEQVPVQGVLDPRFNKASPVYITFDPTSEESNFTYLTLGAGELSFNLVQALGKQIEPACAVDDGTEVCENRTIINCDNADGRAVMFLKTAEPTGVFIDGTCIVMQGNGLELLRSIDRVLYNWYGVMR